MLLAIDAGNSFVKLAYHDGARWLARERISLREFAASALELSKRQAPDHVVICNVAADVFRSPMMDVLNAWGCPALWVSAGESAYGVINGYTIPEQLGADRWAALVAARQSCDTHVVVASIGTAVTIDLLTDQGYFAGGVIFPGPSLMRTCLSEKTQGIPCAEGRYAALPKSTADAVHSGTLNAVAGAVEKSIAVMTRSVEAVEVILTGGGAEQIAPLLGRSCRMAPDLVLEGLLHIAGKEGMK